MLFEVDHRLWRDAVSPAVAAAATEALEQGGVLHLPSLAFAIAPDEDRLFVLDTARAVKNVSFAPQSGKVSGVDASGADLAMLARALSRFSTSAVSLARTLFPSYATRLEVARASFRPAEIAGRQTSWRKDDTRLHVDSFPSSPTGGKRILRVFSNVNPHGQARSWRLGAAFSDIVSRYQPRLRLPWPGEAAALRALRITKSRRTPYDALMLQLHDLMKRDDEYQRASDQTTVAFAPGSTWVAFTDEVSHAAMAGRYQFEQTMLLPVDAMRDESRAPLRVLERAMRRTLG